METLRELRASAAEDVDELTLMEITDPHATDRIHEIADSTVPIYNHTLLQLAANEPDLALVEPEIGPAFDGSSTPINIIAANCYEQAYEAASERLNERIEEWEEIECDWDDAEYEFDLSQTVRPIIAAAAEIWYGNQH